MEVITKGFQNKEVAEYLVNECKRRASQGIGEFIRFGKLYGRDFDIAYVGKNTIEITNY